MATLTEKRSSASASPKKIDDAPPVRLRTRTEVRDYLAKHLTPVRRGPKGQPIYAQKDLESLNVLFPEDC